MNLLVSISKGPTASGSPRRPSAATACFRIACSGSFNALTRRLTSLFRSNFFTFGLNNLMSYPAFLCRYAIHLAILVTWIARGNSREVVRTNDPPASMSRIGSAVEC